MSRTVPSPRTRDLAQQLLAYEAATDKSFEADMPAAFRVSEKLRRRLSKLAGAAGFSSLLERALSLAKAQSPGLDEVHVKPDGSLEKLNELHQDEAAEAGALLIAHLLGLLTTFIGEGLTARVVHDTWPDFSVDDANHGEQTQDGPPR